MKALLIVLLMVSLPAMADVQCVKYPSTDYPPQVVTFKGDRCPIGWQPA